MPNLWATLFSQLNGGVKKGGKKSLGTRPLSAASYADAPVKPTNDSSASMSEADRPTSGDTTVARVPDYINEAAMTLAASGDACAASRIVVAANKIEINGLQNLEPVTTDAKAAAEPPSSPTFADDGSSSASTAIVSATIVSRRTSTSSSTPSESATSECESSTLVSESDISEESKLKKKRRTIFSSLFSYSQIAKSVADTTTTSARYSLDGQTLPDILKKKRAKHGSRASLDLKNKLIGKSWGNPQIPYHALIKELKRMEDRSMYRSLRNTVINWLKKNTTVTTTTTDELNAGRRVLIQWLRAIVKELFESRIYTGDLPLYFECVLLLITRNEFEELDQVGPTQADEPEGQARQIPEEILSEYYEVMTDLIKRVIFSLSDMGVLTNWISFCARIMAWCFFKIPGVAIVLLRSLQVREVHMRRLLDEIMKDNESRDERITKQNAAMMQVFPSHLAPLCFLNQKTWWKRMRDAPKECSNVIEISGNCRKRWQSDDSELFFSFYKHYHVVLKTYLTRYAVLCDGLSSPSDYITAPGYLHLAGFFLQKIESLVHHRSIYTITSFNMKVNGTWQPFSPRAKPTDSSAKAFNMGKMVGLNETVNEGRKPAALEAAGSRFAETIASIVEQGMFEQMCNVWIRTAVKKTNMYDPEGVFCLFDFMDDVIEALDKRTGVVCSSNRLDQQLAPSGCGTSLTAILDVPFYVSLFRRIFENCDHTTTILRAICFIYTHFSLLTARPHCTEMLAIDLLLDKHIFDKLLCHWSRQVRIYFVRLLVWRVKRVPWKAANSSRTGSEHTLVDNEALKHGRKVRWKYVRRVKRVIATHNVVSAYKGLQPIEDDLRSICSVSSVDSSSSTASSACMPSPNDVETSDASSGIASHCVLRDEGGACDVPDSLATPYVPMRKASIGWHLALNRDTYAASALEELGLVSKEFKEWKEQSNADADPPGLVISYPRLRDD